MRYQSPSDAAQPWAHCWGSVKRKIMLLSLLKGMLKLCVWSDLPHEVCWIHSHHANVRVAKAALYLAGSWKTLHANYRLTTAVSPLFISWLVRWQNDVWSNIPIPLKALKLLCAFVHGDYNYCHYYSIPVKKGNGQFEKIIRMHP